MSLVPASERDENVLENLLQLYVHDFSEFLGLIPSEEGRFSYPGLSRYWIDEGRSAYLIRSEGNLAGFALVSQGSRISGDSSVIDLAEFFVVRGLRRRNVGRTAAHKLFSSTRGTWEIRVGECNAAALHFWRKIIEQFTSGQFTSEAWTRNDGSRWMVFRFASQGEAAHVPRVSRPISHEKLPESP